MYVLHRRERTVTIGYGPLEGTTRTEPAETRTFTTAAGMFAFLLRERVLRPQFHTASPIKHFGDVWLGRPGQRTYGLTAIDTLSRWEVTFEHVEAMRHAQQRYEEIVHYLRNVEPEWRPDTSVSATGEVRYADNSIEMHEIDKRGNRRRRMLKYPSGDACF